MTQITKGMFKDSESHSHKCLEELISKLKCRLDDLKKVWDENNLGCIKIKEYLIEKGINLNEIGKSIKEITKDIKYTL